MESARDRRLPGGERVARAPRARAEWRIPGSRNSLTSAGASDSAFDRAVDRARRFSWAQVGQGLGLTLIVAVPTLAAAEGLDRSFRPAIDRGGAGWVGFGLVVALAFLAGGAIAARGRATWWMASVQGAALAASGIAVLLGADLVRRGILGQAEGSTTVLFYWSLGILVSLTMSIAGALLWYLAGARRQHSRRA